MGLACPALCKGETQSKAVLTLCDAMRLLIFFFFGMAQYVQAWCKATKRYKAKQAIDFVLHAQTNGIGFFHFLKSAVFERMPRGGTSYALGTVRNATTILETKFLRLNKQHVLRLLSFPFPLATVNRAFFMDIQKVTAEVKMVCESRALDHEKKCR